MRTRIGIVFVGSALIYFGASALSRSAVLAPRAIGIGLLMIVAVLWPWKER